MCGCGQRFNLNPCTILLTIAILGNQGLLGDSPQAKNAITLLLLYWLCGCNNNNRNVAGIAEERPRCKCKKKKIKVCCCK